MKRRILLVDDHELLRRAIKGILRESFTICGECSDGQEAVVKTVALRPDLVLLDVNMPILNGVEAARQIRRAAPSTKILLLSALDPPRLAREAEAAGADGFLTKSRVYDQLLHVIDRLMGAGDQLSADRA